MAKIWPTCEELIYTKKENINIGLYIYEQGLHIAAQKKEKKNMEM